MLKQYCTALLCLLVVLGLCACSAQPAGLQPETPETAAETFEPPAVEDTEEPVLAPLPEPETEREAPTPHEWAPAETVVLTEDQRNLFAEATQALVGAVYTPIAYLGSEVVEGETHRYLCRTQAVIPDAPYLYAVVELYEPLRGELTLQKLTTFDFEVPALGLLGGWAEPETPELTEEAAAAFSQAAEGTDYTAVALVCSQVVSGAQYCILCRDNAADDYALVIVHAAADGSAEIAQTCLPLDLDQAVIGAD